MSKKVHARNAAGKPVCGAKLRGKDKRCHQATALYENGRCKLHGGASLKGLASPSLVHGKYSAHLPPGLQEGFDDMLQHRPGLRENIALADLRVVTAASRLSEGAGLRTWREARDAFRAMQEANAAGDQPKLQAAVSTLGRVLGEGESQLAAWEDLDRAQDSKRKLVATDAKRMMAYAVTGAQVMLLVQALLAALKEECPDPVVVEKTGQRFLRLTAGVVEQAEASA